MAVRVARGNRVSSRRGVLLLGSALGVSIAVLAAAVPNRALAADECGAVPAGATPTVTCTPAGSPYSGVQYDGVEDLTVVIQPDVAVEGLVRVTGSGDLAVDAKAGSTIDNPTGAGVVVTSSGTGSVTAASVSAGYGDGVSVSGETGATVNVGTVSGDWTGVAASSNLGSVIVTSTSVTAVEGRGVFAWARAEGETISITSGTVESYAEGIYAYSGEGGSADVVVDSATVTTTRSGFAAGIVAAATYGDVTVTSGSVTTAGAYSEGILVKAAEGEVYVESDTVHTAGDYSTGIKIQGGLGPVELHSGVVITDGASATGIDVYTDTGAVTVTSDEVSLNGGRAAETTYGEYGSYTDYGRRPVGIDVRSNSGAVTVTSGDIAVFDGTGISVETAGNISITSTGAIVVADGERGGGYGSSSGIYFNSQNAGEGEVGGTVEVTNEGRIELHGFNRNGVYGYGSGAAVTITNAGEIVGYGDSTAVRVHNEGGGALSVINQAGASIHLYDGNSTGVHAGTEDGALTITNAGSIVTEGEYSSAITFHSETGAVTLTSTGVIETSGYGSGAVHGHSYDGDVLVDIASVHAGGDSASGIDVWSQSGSVTVNADLVVTGDACGGEGCFGEGSSFGVRATNGTGDVVIDVGLVTTGDDRAVGVSAGMYGGFLDGEYSGEGEYAFGDIEVTADSVTTSGDWAAGVQVVSGPTSSGPSGPRPIVETGAVSVHAGTIVTHGQGSAGVSVAGASAEDVLGFWSGPMLGGEGGVDPFALVMGPHFGTVGDVEVVVGSVTTDGDGAVGVYASSGFTMGLYGEGEYAGVQPGGDVIVTSGAIETAGDGAIGIVGRALGGGVTIDSGTIETSGDYASGIVAGSGGVGFTRIPIEPEVYTTIPSFISGGLVDIASDEIYTSGESAAGITAIGLGGGITIDSGVIDTEGAYANGIQIMAIGGDVSVDSTRIIARGDEAGGIFVSTANLDSSFGEGEYGSFVAGDVHVTSGTIRTEGSSADGIAVFSGYAFFGEGEYGGGDVDITSASVTTLGDGSAGIRVMAYGRYTYGEDESWELEGDVTVHSGAVITSGRYSDGISIEADLGDVSVTATGVATSGLSSRGIDIYAESGDVVVNATAVTTSGGRASEEVSYYDGYTESWVYETRYGNASDGVRVITEDGDVTINAQNVTVSGDQATGVLVESENGDVALNLGAVHAQGEAGDAVHVYAYEGDIGVNVSGQVSSANGAGVHAYSYYGGVDVTLAAGSRVQGGTVGIYAYSDTGTTITINGTVSAASGLAIDVKGLGAATIHNLSNTVIGGVSLTDGDDLFDNTGTFQATIDSQFGEGVDLFDNTGLLQILPGSNTPGTIVFQGLETFDNAGVVDLANGHAGDVFDLSSATWNGLAGSTLELDVSDSGGDTLLVDDAAGHTTIVLSGAGGGIGQSLELVVSNADETGDEFDLQGDTGFVKFVMDFDAATDTWSAIGTADTEVFEPGRFLAGAQNFWNETGDAWSARMTELRDIGSDRGQGAQGWVQAFGGEQSEDRGTERFTLGGLPSDVNLAYEQSYRGLQTGVDWTSGAGVVGVTVGFGDSDQRMASGNSAEFGGFNLGAYGGWNAGAFFVNGLVKADVYKARLGLRTLHASEEVDGRTWGAKAEAGWRVGGDGWFFEPSARLSWTDVDMDGFSAAGGAVDFGDASSLLGEAGARIGTRWTNGVVDLVPYLGLFAIDEFDGENQTAFSIAGDSFRLTDEAAGAHGRVDFGVTAATFYGLEGFVKGEALVGGDAEGYSARLGVRWRW